MGYEEGTCADTSQEGAVVASGCDMTFGEKAVGLTFNPSGDEVVSHIKNLYAEIIDICNDERSKENVTQADIEKKRLLSIAITEAQGAQMWVVKALTWKD